MRTGIIVTYNGDTKVNLIVEEEQFNEKFNGVYEAATFAMEHGINLKHHINNHPGAIG